jgi:hypothetical protein
VVHYTVQQAADGGTNVTVGGAPAARPVTVTANSSVMSSQTASGAGSNVVGGQLWRLAAMPSPPTRMPPYRAQAASLRKWAGGQGCERGAVVAFSTIIGAVAAVAGVIIAILIAVDRKP